MNVPAPMRQASVQRASLPAVIGTGRGVLGILGLAGTAATLAPIIIDPLTGKEKKLRVTRKLRSDVKKAVEMFGVEMVADEMGTTIEVIFYILTKKMRNDGPYVTRAAVRKTRQTGRKVSSFCEQFGEFYELRRELHADHHFASFSLRYKRLLR